MQMAQSVEPELGSTAVVEGKAAKGVTELVPLDSPSRVHPIHAHLPEVRLPSHVASDPWTVEQADEDPNRLENTTRKASTIVNPVTLQPFSIDELRSHNLESLLRQYPNPEAADKAREETVKELRKLIDDNERKSKEIDREMEEKEKTREIERKVYARKVGREG